MSVWVHLADCDHFYWCPSWFKPMAKIRPSRKYPQEVGTFLVPKIFKGRNDVLISSTYTQCFFFTFLLVSHESVPFTNHPCSPGLLILLFFGLPFPCVTTTSRTPSRPNPSARPRRASSSLAAVSPFSDA